MSTRPILIAVITAAVHVSYVFGAFQIKASDFVTECPCLYGHSDPIRTLKALSLDSCVVACRTIIGCIGFSYCVSSTSMKRFPSLGLDLSKDSAPAAIGMKKNKLKPTNLIFNQTTVARLKSTPRH